MFLLQQQTETVDIGTCDQSIPKAYPDIGTYNLVEHSTESVFCYNVMIYTCLLSAFLEHSFFILPAFDGQLTFLT